MSGDRAFKRCPCDSGNLLISYNKCFSGNESPRRTLFHFRRRTHGALGKAVSLCGPGGLWPG